jgi:hypothetical protein
MFETNHTVMAGSGSARKLKIFSMVHRLTPDKIEGVNSAIFLASFQAEFLLKNIPYVHKFKNNRR